MDFIIDVLFWGIVIGIIHYIIMGVLYMNPIVNKVYIEAQEKDASVKTRKTTSEYLTKQFLGTQVEIWIITASFLYLRQFLPIEPIYQGLVLGAIFSGVRIYERFWNMLIQTTYPPKLLAIEFVNGIIGTLVITIGLSLMPINY